MNNVAKTSSNNIFSFDKEKKAIEKLGLEYLDSADKVRLRAKKLELALEAKDFKKDEMKNIHLRIELLYTQYRDTKKIGENLINYYNKTKKSEKIELYGENQKNNNKNSFKKNIPSYSNDTLPSNNQIFSNKRKVV